MAPNVKHRFSAGRGNCLTFNKHSLIATLPTKIGTLFLGLVPLPVAKGLIRIDEAHGLSTEREGGKGRESTISNRT